jgi:hypothetical protein
MAMWSRIGSGVSQRKLKAQALYGSDNSDTHHVDPVTGKQAEGIVNCPCSTFLPAAASTFPDISWRWWNEMRYRYQQNSRFCSDSDGSYQLWQKKPFSR